MSTRIASTDTCVHGQLQKCEHRKRIRVVCVCVCLLPYQSFALAPCRFCQPLDKDEVARDHKAVQLCEHWALATNEVTTATCIEQDRARRNTRLSKSPAARESGTLQLKTGWRSAGCPP